MVRQFLPISALLLGSALLLFAGGINGLILPVRGGQEGFSSLSLGLLGTGWAIGYVTGCILSPRLVGRVGHVRAFGVMAAFAAITILMSLLVMVPWAWIVLRSISGFCFAGAAMIVESWLSERADPGSRGRIFGLYTMVNLVASTGGQMSLTLGDTSTFLYFVLGAIFYCLAMVPTAISSTSTPQPLVSVKLDIRALWRNSPVSVFSVLFVGVSNGAFGTLAAVYASKIGLPMGSVALFTSLPVLAGAVAQMPIGWLSDRIDRRKVLVGVTLAAIAVDVAFIVLRPEELAVNLALSALFGATIFSMYPILVAHANDHADEGMFIQTSGGLLMVYGLGSMFGPLVAGAGMFSFGTGGLFATTICAHVAIVGFAIWRILTRAPVDEGRKGAFISAPPGRSSTPETAALAVGDEGRAVDV